LRPTGRSFRDLLRDRVFLGYALSVAFAYASLFGHVSGSSFALQDHYDLSGTQFSAVFALNAAGMVVLGLLNARLVRRLPVRRLLFAGLAASSVAAGVLVLAVTAGASLGVLVILPPLFLVVAARGLVSSNATALGVERGSRSAGSASAVLGACTFGGGVLVTPLVGLGPEGRRYPWRS
jgi:DHA1 family bicyclomycin/chloramphenicol resistance-like MFS transporter